MKLFTCSLLLLLTFAAVAQTTHPTVELNGSYQFNYINANGSSVNADYGWEASANVPLNNWFGVVSNFSGTSADKISLNTYGGGLQLTDRQWAAIQPFARVILTDAQFSSDNYSANKFGQIFGGGVDFRLTKMFWLRGQVDYLHTDVKSYSVNGVRPSAGITLRF